MKDFTNLLITLLRFYFKKILGYQILIWRCAVFIGVFNGRLQLIVFNGLDEAPIKIVRLHNRQMVADSPFLIYGHKIPPTIQPAWHIVSHISSTLPLEYICNRYFLKVEEIIHCLNWELVRKRQTNKHFKSCQSLCEI